MICYMTPDPVLLPEEILYMRLSARAFMGGYQQTGLVSLNEIRFPDISVNCHKYSMSPEDVLIPKPNWGFVSFLVKNIPARETVDDPNNKDVYTFVAEHEPLPNKEHPDENKNDAHCNIWSYRNGEKLPHESKKPPTLVKSKFREKLRKEMKVEKEADNGFN